MRIAERKFHGSLPVEDQIEDLRRLGSPIHFAPRRLGAALHIIIFGRAVIASDGPGQEEFAVSWQLPISKRKQ